MTPADAPGRGPIKLTREFADWGPTSWAAHDYPTFLGAPLALTLGDLHAAGPDVVMRASPASGTS